MHLKKYSCVFVIVAFYFPDAFLNKMQMFDREANI